MIKTIQQYESACELVAKAFIKEYYEEAEWFWVGDEIGGVLCFGDEFFNMYILVDILKYKPTYEQLMEWYYDVYINEEAETNYNLKSYLGLFFLMFSLLHL